MASNMNIGVTRTGIAPLPTAKPAVVRQAPLPAPTAQRDRAIATLGAPTSAPSAPSFAATSTPPAPGVMTATGAPSPAPAPALTWETLGPRPDHKAFSDELRAMPPEERAAAQQAWLANRRTYQDNFQELLAQKDRAGMRAYQAQYAGGDRGKERDAMTAPPADDYSHEFERLAQEDEKAAKQAAKAAARDAPTAPAVDEARRIKKMRESRTRIEPSII